MKYKSVFVLISWFAGFVGSGGLCIFFNSAKVFGAWGAGPERLKDLVLEVDVLLDAGDLGHVLGFDLALEGGALPLHGHENDEHVAALALADAAGFGGEVVARLEVAPHAAQRRAQPDLAVQRREDAIAPPLELAGPVVLLLSA